MKFFDLKPRSKGLPLAVGDDFFDSLSLSEKHVFSKGFRDGVRSGFRLIFIGVLVFFSLGFGLGIQFVHAETKSDPWPKVAFADWPKISVDQIKEPSPLLFPSDLPGSVQPKKLPSVDQARFCNFRTTGGYYVLQRCD